MDGWMLLKLNALNSGIYLWFYGGQNWNKILKNNNKKTTQTNKKSKVKVVFVWLDFHFD